MRRLLLLLLALSALTPASANGHASPPGCASNLAVGLSRDVAMARPGQTVDYTVTGSNVGMDACEVSNVTATFTPPTGPAAVIGQGLTFPTNTPLAIVGAASWTVPAGQAAGSAVAELKVSGTVHDAAVDHTVDITRTLGVAIVVPKLELTFAADPATGQAPLPVTFKYQLKNLSAPAAPLTNPQITHPLCTRPVVLAGGDTDGDKALDPDETWNLTCTRDFDTAGDYSATASATATSASDGGIVTASAPAVTVKVATPPSTAHLSLTKSVSPTSGFAPLGVTYSYTVVNGGGSALTGVTVEDAGCRPVLPATVDLAVGATQIFTCSAVLGAGFSSSSAVASATDTVTKGRLSSALSSADVTVARVPDPEATPVVLPDSSSTPKPAPTPSARVRFAYTGRFTPARSCRGTVNLALRAGTRAIASKRVRLDSRCRYKVSFDVARTRLGRATTVTVTAKTGKRSASRRLNVPTR